MRQHADAHKFNHLNGADETQSALVALITEAGSIASDENRKSGHKAIAQSVINTIAMLVTKQFRGTEYKEPLDTARCEIVARLNKQWSRDKSWALGDV